ncbi:MAG: hypothetical protein KAJ49_02125 [Arcobacteraceae bacterium]|nr:hypothetical protein [Arcobacteraceae bacterium]
MNKQTRIEVALSEKTNINLLELKMSVKLLVSIAMLNVENIEKKFELITDSIVEYFNLESVLESGDIAYIFLLVVDNKDDKLWDITLKEVQTFYLAFVLGIEDRELKTKLFYVLEEVLKLSNTVIIEEEFAKDTYAHLLHSDNNQEEYEPILEKIDNHHSTYLYSKNGLKPETFSKKVNKALNSYAKDIYENDVISLYDNTIFGGADEGFIITKLGILTTQDEDISVIPFSIIYKVTYDKDGMTFYSIEEDNNELKIAYLPRYNNIRILANILNQFGAINKTIDEKEE